jgi:hypothetical protein
MSSDAIEEDLSHFEANSIFSPSMPTTDISFELISKPILDPDDPFYILSSKNYDGPRNPLRHPKHRSHEAHKEEQEEQRHALLQVKNGWIRPNP